MMQKDTDKISAYASTLGYVCEWNMADAKNFHVPHSRPRAYGLATLKAAERTSTDKETKALRNSWTLIRRLQCEKVESMATLMERASWGSPASSSWKRRKQQQRCAKAEPKWEAKREAFKKQEGLSEESLASAACAKLRSRAESLGLTERELEVAVLSFAAAEKKQPGFAKTCEESVYVANVGESVTFGCRWKRNVHPCLTPDKKYLYLVFGQAALNQGCREFHFALQGVGPDEQDFFGVPGSLKPGEVQDLTGNAFCANVMAACLMATLIYLHPRAAKQQQL